MSKGGGGGGNSGYNYTETKVDLPDYVNTQAQQNIATANQLASQPYTAYTGQEVAGLTPDQQAAAAAVEQLQGGTQPVFGQAISNIQNLPQTIQGLMSPYLSQVEGDTVSNIQRAAALQGQQQEAQAVGAGAFGGTRDAVQRALLQSETQRNIGQAVDSIQQQGYSAASQLALSQAQEQAGLATAGQTAALQQAGALDTVGGQQQQQQQAELSNALQNWQAQQNWAYQQLAVQEGALAGTPYGSTVTASQPYNQNTAASLLGTAASALPIVNQLGKWAGLWGGSSGAAGAASSAAGKGAADAGASTAGAIGGDAAKGAADTAGAAAATDTAGKGAGDAAVAALAL